MYVHECEHNHKALTVISAWVTYLESAQAPNQLELLASMNVPVNLGS